MVLLKPFRPKTECHGRTAADGLVWWSCVISKSLRKRRLVCAFVVPKPPKRAFLTSWPTYFYLSTFRPLKRQEKYIWKCRLLKSSAANNCQTLMMNLSIEANSVDPEQTAPIGAVWSGSSLFVIEASYTFQQTRKADDFCCDWHFRISTQVHMCCFKTQLWTHE